MMKASIKVEIYNIEDIFRFYNKMLLGRVPKVLCRRRKQRANGANGANVCTANLLPPYHWSKPQRNCSAGSFSLVECHSDPWREIWIPNAGGHTLKEKIKKSQWIHTFHVRTLLPTALAVGRVFVLFNTVNQSEKFFSLKKERIIFNSGRLYAIASLRKSSAIGTSPEGGTTPAQEDQIF